MNHDYQRPPVRDHITISLGHSRFWLSVVEERDGGWDCHELALIRYVPAEHVLDYRSIECVRLSEWWDSSSDEDELALDHNIPELYGFASQADLLVQAIKRANDYVRSVSSTQVREEV